MKQKRQHIQLHLLGLTGLDHKTGRGRNQNQKRNGGQSQTAYGGDHTRGRRKTRRPFDPKQPLHVVLRSTKARGRLSMLNPRHCNHIRALIDKIQKRRFVRVYRYANVGNHLHLLVRAKSRADWKAFIRELAGGVAMIVTGARKGMALKRTTTVGVSESALRGFWDGLVYTRIVGWGRDFTRVARYVCTNLWEGMGVPVRKMLERGYRCLDISDDGAVLVSKNISREALEYLERDLIPC